jgi:quercetin dioxygenase-like cupin family protein
MLKINSAEINDLSQMVDYQIGAVVSREIIQKTTGTITIFAFDAGQGLSEHKAPFDALVQILEGEAEVMINDKYFQLKQGEMIILPVDVIHALKAINRFKMMLIMIR